MSFSSKWACLVTRRRSSPYRDKGPADYADFHGYSQLFASFGKRKIKGGTSLCKVSPFIKSSITFCTAKCNLLFCQIKSSLAVHSAKADAKLGRVLLHVGIKRHWLFHYFLMDL